MVWDWFLAEKDEGMSSRGFEHDVFGLNIPIFHTAQRTSHLYVKHKGKGDSYYCAQRLANKGGLRRHMAESTQWTTF